MAVEINEKGASHAKSLIRKGAIDYDSDWSFSADDGNKILNEGWDEYSKWFLAIDTEASEETKERYKFPYGKNGKVYRRGVIAAKVRAAQNNYTSIANLAGELLDMIDEKNSTETKAQSSQLSFRSLASHPLTLDEETRSVEVIIATDAPVEVYDYTRGRTIREILTMDGVILPPTRQLPLLDSHNRFAGTAAVIGSVRNIRVESSQLIGRAYFASDSNSQTVFTKIKEGHLTDVSVGYIVMEEEVNEDGTMRKALAWQPFEVSICPIGADANAKVRSKEFEIKPELQKQQQEIKGGRDMEERERVLEIIRHCKLVGKEGMAEAFIADGLSVDEVKTKLLEAIAEERKQETPVAKPVIDYVADERDKFRAAAVDALLLRSGKDVSKPAPGAEDLTGLTLKELARECLRLAGQKDKGPVMELVERAISTSDLPYLLKDVAEKYLYDGFDSAETTWQVWCGTGSVTDFKEVNIVQLSALSILSEVPEAGEYILANISDAREVVKAKTYGLMFPITRQTIINDDLNALTSIPRKLGEAAARTVNYAVYSYLTSNPTMGDGVALFHSSHGNVGTAGAVSETTIGEAIKLMKKQKDISGKQPLNIIPRYFIAPVAIEATAEIFFNSQMFASDNKGATRTNIYAGNVFTRVYDPFLDDSSATAWYLAAAKDKTINVYFLNGVRTPYLERQESFERDIIQWKVRLDFGVKAVDWRGLVKNAGA